MSLEDRVAGLVASIGSRSLPDFFRDVEDLLAAGEWGVAFETLCDAVYETEVALFDGEIHEFEVVGQYLATASPLPDRGVWRLVRELLSSDEVSGGAPR